MCKFSLTKRDPEKDLLAIALVDELEVKCCHLGCSWIGVESVRKKHQRCCSYKPRSSTIVNLSKKEVVTLNEEEEKVEEAANTYDLTS